MERRKRNSRKGLFLFLKANCKGFLYGYNSVVWTAIGFQASGGIIVGLCVAYADTILKNFASLLSVLISGVASVYFFDFIITMHVIILHLGI